MANNDYILTPEGKEKLEQELHYLEHEKRASGRAHQGGARVRRHLRELRVRRRQEREGMTEARIAEINRILSEATVVSTPKRSSKVNIGSTVTVDMNGP